MLSLDIRALDTTPAQVHDDLPADDPVWLDSDPRPTGAVHVEGRISAAGEDRFYFHGRIKGSVRLDCRRCLVDVHTDVNEEAQFLLVPVGDATAGDDPDVYLYDPAVRTLDLRPAVRESWLLGVPAFVQCSPDCKGLCLHCGTDLNTGSCECTPVSTDSRWDASRNATLDPPSS